VVRVLQRRHEDYIGGQVLVLSKEIRERVAHNALDENDLV
jgi:hypothetical protein